MIIFAAGDVPTADQLTDLQTAIVAYGLRTSDKTGITAETACLRLDSIAMRSGIRYRVSVSGRPYSSVATDTYKLRFRYDATGAAATTSSTLLGTTWEETQAHGCTHWATYTPGADQTVSIVVTLARAVGSGTVSLNGDSFFEMVVEALGSDPGDTGVDL